MNQYVTRDGLSPVAPMMKLSGQGAAAFEQSIRQANAAIDALVCGTSAIVLPLGMAFEILRPKANGVRVVHDRRRDLSWGIDLGRHRSRWCAVIVEPVRVRTCRGSRR
jgi:hypothetical protein